MTYFGGLCKMWDKVWQGKGKNWTKIVWQTLCKDRRATLRHFSLTVAGLRVPLSRFLEGALYKYPEWMNEWIKCRECRLWWGWGLVIVIVNSKFLQCPKRRRSMREPAYSQVLNQNQTLSRQGGQASENHSDKQLWCQNCKDEGGSVYDESGWNLWKEIVFSFDWKTWGEIARRGALVIS